MYKFGCLRVCHFVSFISASFCFTTWSHNDWKTRPSRGLYQRNVSIKHTSCINLSFDCTNIKDWFILCVPKTFFFFIVLQPIHNKGAWAPASKRRSNWIHETSCYALSRHCMYPFSFLLCLILTYLSLFRAGVVMKLISARKPCIRGFPRAWEMLSLIVVQVILLDHCIQSLLYKAYSSSARSYWSSSPWTN